MGTNWVSVPALPMSSHRKPYEAEDENIDQGSADKALGILACVNMVGLDGAQ